MELILRKGKDFFVLFMLELIDPWFELLFYWVYLFKANRFPSMNYKMDSPCITQENLLEI